jgi:glycerol-3-phosphate dehydrogenase subunit C
LYGFRKEHYYQSLQIGSPLFKQLKDKKLDFGVSECNLCRLQMMHGSKKPAKHPVHILAESYDFYATVQQRLG